MAPKFFALFLYLQVIVVSSASGSATHNKFKQWYSYYGEVLGNEVLGTGGPPYNNCKPNVTAYDLTTNHVDATSRCYNGEAHGLSPNRPPGILTTHFPRGSLRLLVQWPSPE